MPGLVQISIDKGESFADKLKSVLRLDPDVLMLGEIRDEETTKTALQAALTGHLVLSTYHAPSAPAALLRLIDAMDTNPLLLGSIRLVVSQRLVRKLDQATCEKYTPTEFEINYLKQVISKFDPKEKPDIDWNNLKLSRPVISPDSPFWV